MNLRTWAITLFSIYRYLEKLANSIDKIVNLRALNSFNMSKLSSINNEMLKVSEDINNLTDKKIVLINLKVLTQNILKNIKKDYARLLILRYIENKKIEDISNIMKISVRTAFRWRNLALQSCVNEIKKMDFSCKKLVSLVKNEDWIFEVYKSIDKPVDDFNYDKFNEYKFINSVYKEYRRTVNG